MEDTVQKNWIEIINHAKDTVQLEVLFLHHGLSRNSFIDAYRDRVVYSGEEQLHRNAKIRPGEIVRIKLTPEESEFVPEPIPFFVLSEDRHFLAMEKPEGIPMLPRVGSDSGSLANRVQAYFNLQGLQRKIRFVNRLDQGTSGIVLVAKHKYAHGFLQKQMNDGTVKKKYLAIIEGKMREEKGAMHYPLKKDGNSPKHLPDSNGIPAQTNYQVLWTGAKYSILCLTLITGKTHQIRAHLAAEGSPVAGDILYGAEPLDRIYLHSFSYRFKDWNGRIRTLISQPEEKWAYIAGVSDQQWNEILRKIRG